jgi:hypothetical protein
MPVKGLSVHRRKAVMMATAGMTVALAPVATQAQDAQQEVKIYQVADATMAANLMNTLVNGGEGCGNCAYRIVAFSLTPNDTGYDLIVVTTGGIA